MQHLLKPPPGPAWTAVVPADSALAVLLHANDPPATLDAHVGREPLVTVTHRLERRLPLPTRSRTCLRRTSRTSFAYGCCCLVRWRPRAHRVSRAAGMFFGGGDGIRTRILLVGGQTLGHFSFTPLEATGGVEPPRGGFAGPRLTAWLRRLGRSAWARTRDLRLMRAPLSPTELRIYGWDGWNRTNDRSHIRRLLCR